ncbi:MAG: hypothetical protein HY795_02315 [Desulfovibrio sp.]|nr:hypothetical protein [Desulfovibrio sp.]MBI4961170.1 hypothetical protein [Desulfovibrio sp.]
MKTLTLLESGFSDMCTSFDDPNLSTSEIQKFISDFDCCSSYNFYEGYLEYEYEAMDGKTVSGKIYEVKGDGFNEETDMLGMKVTYLEPESMPNTSEKALYVWGIEAPEDLCHIWSNVENFDPSKITVELRKAPDLYKGIRQATSYESAKCHLTRHADGKELIPSDIDIESYRKQRDEQEDCGTKVGEWYTRIEIVTIEYDGRTRDTEDTYGDGAGSYFGVYRYYKNQMTTYEIASDEEDEESDTDE